MTKAAKSWTDAATELAARLLDVVPVRREVDWGRCVAALWQPSFWGGRLTPHEDLDDIRLSDLLCIDGQKSRIDANTRQFVKGYPANNTLLWGSRGTGKSSLVHALLNEYAGDNLRLVEVNKHQLAGLSDIVMGLREAPYRFIVFCDDLSFEAEDPSYKVLKSALEGSMFKASANVLIYATSNRRHLLPEYMSDNAQAQFVEGELHQSEAVEEKVSLSDRFGLWLSFYPFKQDAYVEVVQHWLRQLGEAHGLSITFTDELRSEALRWALARGVRSGRTAQHFARDWVGRALLSSPAEGD
jgi:predicted AAA+ superfamily ATPase